MKTFKKFLLYAAVCIPTMQTFAQLTLVIDSLPQYYTPLFDSIYVTGTFNNWNFADPNYAFQKKSNGTYSVTINGSGTVQYLVSRGDSNSFEAQSNGVVQSYRTFTYNGYQDTVHLNIKAWKDYPPSFHTATNNVFVMQSKMYMPQLHRTRRVWIYFPNDYFISEKSYPVVYAQDGQNIFDTSEAHHLEWCIDDSLSKMQFAGDTASIVVAVDNGGKYRNDEYCPYKISGISNGEGDKYAAFLVQTLKPLIDKSLRTKSYRIHTIIAGSSLGGLISFYTALKYQNVFSKVAAISPSYSTSDSIYTFAKAHGFQYPMRIYQACGNDESFTMLAGLDKMKDVLLYQGFTTENFQSIFRPKGIHNESYWRIEFPLAYRWLFNDSTMTHVQHIADPSEINIFPNPSNKFLYVHNVTQEKLLMDIQIVDMLGRNTGININSLIQSDHDMQIPISTLKSGMYLLVLRFKNTNAKFFRFVKN